MKALWQALNEAFKAISQPPTLNAVRLSCRPSRVGSFDLSLAIR
jgi:hypothetical protein